MRISTDIRITRDNDLTSLFGKFLHPVNIGRIGRKKLLKMND